MSALTDEEALLRYVAFNGIKSLPKEKRLKLEKLVKKTGKTLTEYLLMYRTACETWSKALEKSQEEKTLPC